MIDLADLRRVRLHGGTRVHAIAASDRFRITACGKYVHLWINDRPHDQPREPAAAVTCRACLRATKEPR